MPAIITEALARDLVRARHAEAATARQLRHARKAAPRRWSWLAPATTRWWRQHPALPPVAIHTEPC